MADRNHLEHWRSVHGKYIAVTEFLSWLESEYRIRLDYDDVNPEKPAPLELSKLLDEFFEVDQAGLERVRRELLEEIRREGRN